jgi:hypothetical protein
VSFFFVSFVFFVVKFFVPFELPFRELRVDRAYATATSAAAIEENS